MMFFINLIIAICSEKYPKIEIKTFGALNNFGKTHQRICDFQNWNKIKSHKKGIILGSSTAYRNINTAILDSNTNIQWFNLGSTSQTPEISFELLKYANEKKNISVVILDFYPPLLANNGEECTLDLIKNSNLPLITKFNIIKNSKKSIRIFNQLFYREIKRQLRLKNHFDTYAKDIYTCKGFVTNNKAAIKIENHQIKNLNLNIPILNQIQSYCEQYKIKLLINVAPIADVTYDTNVSNDPRFITNQDFINSKTKENCFYDSHHMTYLGSYLYTHHLANKINAKFNK